MPVAIVETPSPHHNERPAGTKILCIVLHADAGKTEAGTIAHLQNPDLPKTQRVSYHYFIGRDGRLYRFVKDHRRAWHAGISEWHGMPNVNDFSLGVSFANDQLGEEFTPAQIDTGVLICVSLCQAYKLQPQNADIITTHALTARPKGRKVDPGPKFPFAVFRGRVIAGMLSEPFTG